MRLLGYKHNKRFGKDTAFVHWDLEHPVPPVVLKSESGSKNYIDCGKIRAWHGSTEHTLVPFVSPGTPKDNYNIR